MLINMKYYITTIGAIFIALGIGILIGFNLDGDIMISEQQLEMVNKLEEKISEVKAQNETLSGTIAGMEKQRADIEKYIEYSSEHVIKDRLAGKNIAIIQTTEDYFYPNTGAFLQKAGGGVPFELLLKDSLIKDLDIKAFNQEFGTSFATSADIVNHLCKTIFEEKNMVFANTLAQKGYVQINAGSMNLKNIDAVVIESGATKEDKEKMQIFDGNVVEYLKGKNVRVVGVERTDVEFSHVPFFKAAKISSVDNVNNILGEISLVMALDGKSGHFGEKETAEAILPQELN